MPSAAPRPAAPPLLAIRGPRERFGPNEIPKGVDLGMRSGEAVSITGSSRTTLPRCVSLLEEFEAGEVVATVKALAAEGTTLLPVTHEMRFARDVSHAVVFMEKGLVAEHGPPGEVFGAPKLPRPVEVLRNTRDG